MNRKDLKILQLSNSFDSPSGYGVQSKGTLFDWNKYYNVRQIANYGFQARMRGFSNPFDSTDKNILRVYAPLPGDEHGGKTARLIFNNWKPDVFVTLYDNWMGAFVEETPQGLMPIHPRMISWVMVDHDPIPEGTLLCSAPSYRVVTPTRFGVEQFAKHGVSALLIPFGVSTSDFHPQQSDEDKRECKRRLGTRSVPFNVNDQLGIDENSFVIMLNGANKDPYRKDFPRAFTALQLFLQANPDAVKDTRCYVHSWMKMARDIPHGAKVLSVDRYCRGTADYHNLNGVPDSVMCELYGAADVFLHPSQGGGFEVPLLEASACAVPTITQDFVGFRELVEGHGWLVKSKTKYFTALDALQGIADEYQLADALEDAYNHPEKRKSLGDAGRAWSLGFDWKCINPLWHTLFDEIIQEIEYKPLETRRL